MGIRHIQTTVVENETFAGIVEASMMRVAYDVLEEPAETPGHEQRAGVARALFQGMPQDVTRFRRLFSWYAVNVPEIQSQVYQGGQITPEALADDAIDEAVRTFWNTAADVPRTDGS